MQSVARHRSVQSLSVYKYDRLGCGFGEMPWSQTRSCRGQVAAEIKDALYHAVDVRRHECAMQPAMLQPAAQLPQQCALNQHAVAACYAQVFASLPCLLAARLQLPAD